MQPTPTRTFIVAMMPGTPGPENEAFQAHQPHIDAAGALTLLRYDELNRIPWSIALFAPGTWYGVRATVPTIEEMRVMDANEAEARSLGLQRAQFEMEATRELAKGVRKGTVTN